MIYLHDHNTGLPRGQTPAKLHLTEESKEETSQTKQDDKQDSNSQEQAQDTWNSAYGDGSGDVNAVKGGKKGQGKGYGACWHCGEWGHPRRECPQLTGANTAFVNALKVKGKGFKGGKGKGFKGGKGKGFKGKNNWQYRGGYRSPGKAIVKGSNYYSNEDYNEACGS